MSTETAAASVVRRDKVSPRRHGLSGFRVAGDDDQHLAFTEPVEVRCLGCGPRKRFGEFAETAPTAGMRGRCNASEDGGLVRVASTGAPGSRSRRERTEGRRQRRLRARSTSAAISR